LWLLILISLLSSKGVLLTIPPLPLHFRYSQTHVKQCLFSKAFFRASCIGLFSPLPIDLREIVVQIVKNLLIRLFLFTRFCSDPRLFPDINLLAPGRGPLKLFFVVIFPPSYPAILALSSLTMLPPLAARGSCPDTFSR